MTVHFREVDAAAIPEEMAHEQKVNKGMDHNRVGAVKVVDLIEGAIPM